MCTATWLRHGEGYEVFFNRDELRSRKPALPPEVGEREGVRYLAPIDGDAGGTWLGANEHGISIGLANGPVAAPADRKRSFRSRGLLVLDLLASASLEDVARRLERTDPSIHRPFSLFALAPGREPVIWSSDGAALEARPAAAQGSLLFSSSRDAERARAERQSLLDRMVLANGGLAPKLLAAFHASHEPERGAFSPCMHREDASTVSFTRIRVGNGEVILEYRPGPPCEKAEVVRRTLVLRKS